MTLQQAFIVLGLDGQSLLMPLTQTPTIHDAVKLWQSVRVRIKQVYKAKVFDHHPDRGGDVAIFHSIQQAFEMLDNDDLPYIVWQAAHPPRVQVVLQPTYSFTSSFGTGNTTTATTTCYNGVFDTCTPFFIRRNF